MGLFRWCRVAAGHIALLEAGGARSCQMWWDMFPFFFFPLTVNTKNFLFFFFFSLSTYLFLLWLFLFRVLCSAVFTRPLKLNPPCDIFLVCRRIFLPLIFIAVAFFLRVTCSVIFKLAPLCMFSSARVKGKVREVCIVLKQAGTIVKACVTSQLTERLPARTGFAICGGHFWARKKLWIYFGRACAFWNWGLPELL